MCLECIDYRCNFLTRQFVFLALAARAEVRAALGDADAHDGRAAIRTGFIQAALNPQIVAEIAVLAVRRSIVAQECAPFVDRFCEHLPDAEIQALNFLV
jgi:hypothetical protein